MVWSIGSLLEKVVSTFSTINYSCKVAQGLSTLRSCMASHTIVALISANGSSLMEVLPLQILWRYIRKTLILPKACLKRTSSMSWLLVTGMAALPGVQDHKHKWIQRTSSRPLLTPLMNENRMLGACLMCFGNGLFCFVHELEGVTNLNQTALPEPCFHISKSTIRSVRSELPAMFAGLKTSSSFLTRSEPHKSPLLEKLHNLSKATHIESDNKWLWDGLETAYRASLKGWIGIDPWLYIITAFDWRWQIGSRKGFETGSSILLKPLLLGKKFTRRWVR